MINKSKDYPVSEIAGLVGLDEKKIQIYCHKGLVGLNHHKNNLGFSDIDYARLRIIKRADDLGYQHEEIKNLIGSADDFPDAEDPFMFYKNFAIRKYKQIYKELGHCEPLEQVKKQCDLKLISTYIKELKKIQPKRLANKDAKKKIVAGNIQPVENIVQKVSTADEYTSTSAPNTLPQHHSDPKDSGSLFHIIASKPKWIFIAAACVAIVIALSTRFGSAPEVDKLETAAEPSPPPQLQAIDKGSNSEAIQPGKTSSIEVNPLKLNAPKEKDDPANGNNSPALVIPPTKKLAENDPLRATFSSMESSATSVPTAELKPPEEPLAPIVMIEDFNLWHDSVKNAYRAEFKIVRNQSTNAPKTVSGWVFVALEVDKEDSDDAKGLIMPAVEFSSGKPAWLPRSGQFIINNYKPMVLSAISSVTPNQISSVQVMVYSSDKKLLLQKYINSPIRTDVQLSEPEKTDSEEKNDNTIQITPISPSASESSLSKPVPTAQESLSKPSKIARPSAIKPQMTDNPEAVAWEQRSYDAAVKGYFDQAIAHATKAIELDPGRVNPYINRSWAYIEKGLLEEAIEDGETALLIDPQNAYAMNNLGLAHHRNSQSPKAKDYYQKACDLGLELGCDNFKSLNNQSRLQQLIDRSQAAFENGDWAMVIRTATEAIELEPQNAIPYTNRSAAYAKLNYLNKALKDSNDAIKYNPDFALSYNNRGYVYELLDEKKKAAADYLKSCSLGLELGCQNYKRLSKAP